MNHFVVAAALYSPAVDHDGGCRVMTVAVAAGDVVDAANTAPARCSAASAPAPLRYDRRTGAARARFDLSPGQSIGRAYLAARAQVLAGDRLAVAARLGVVTVTKDVVAMQDARIGQRFFARGANGAVLVAPPLSPRIRKENP